MKDSEMSNSQTIEVLYDKISMLIESTRRQLATAINVAMVYTNYEIGRYIVEEEQQGASRAEYGKATLKAFATIWQWIFLPEFEENQTVLCNLF